MEAHERRALPEGWEWKRLGNVITYKKGRKPAILLDEENEGSLQYLTAEYFRTATSNNFVPKEELSNCISCSAQDIILIWDGSNAGDIFRGLNGVVASTMVKIEPQERLHKTYAYFFLKTQFQSLNEHTNGSSIPHVSKSLFDNIKIPLPPLPTQRRIVSILEKAEEATRLRAQADELTNRLLQSVFLEMFGDPVKNPKGWEIKKIGHIAEHVSSGSTPKGGQEVYQDEGILFIRSQNVHLNKLILDDIAFISKDIHNAMKRTWVKRGDVLINITGASIGRVAWYSGDDNSANVNQHVCIIRPKKDAIQTEFLSYQISMPYYQRNIIAKQSGATRQAFNYSQIKDFDIIVPPLPLQQKFARIVEKIESLRQSQNQSKQQIEDLFSALMQKAFRGGI